MKAQQEYESLTERIEAQKEKKLNRFIAALAAVIQESDEEPAKDTSSEEDDEDIVLISLFSLRIKTECELIREGSRDLVEQVKEDIEELVSHVQSFEYESTISEMVRSDVLYIMYGIETIPDSKGASAAWAFEHMQEKTMEILGEQSEEEMQEWLYDSLRWSENFWNQMDLEIYVNSERKLLKDVVYTEVYDQRRIDDWSESMHKTVTELAHREIKKDKRLANWAVDHIVESDKTYNLFKGGRKK